MHEQVERPLRACCGAAVGRPGGEVFSTMGDGIAAAFRRRRLAVQAAIDAQRRACPRPGWRVRMGIHTGEVERVDDDFRGRPVNRAAGSWRSARRPDPAVGRHGLARARRGSDAVELVDLGTHQLRDLADPERLWQVVHPDLPATFPALRGLDGHATTCRRSGSSSVGTPSGGPRSYWSSPAGRHADRRRRASARPAWRCRWRPKPAVSVRQRVVRGPRERRDPDDVADSIAGRSGHRAAADPLDDVGGDCSAATDVLLVVDNCEHVVDPRPTVVDRLTAVRPSCRCSPPAGRRSASTASTWSRATARPDDHAAELFRQRAEAPEPTRPRSTCRGRGSCAVGSTACRSRSSWPRPARRRSACCRRVVGRARRPFGLLTAAAAGRCDRHAHDARHDRVVVPAARPGPSSGCSVGSPVPRGRARRAATSPPISASTAGGDRPRHLARAGQEHVVARAERARRALPDARDDAGVRARAARARGELSALAARGRGGWRRSPTCRSRAVQRRGRTQLDPPGARGRQLARGRGVAARRLRRPGRPRWCGPPAACTSCSAATTSPTWCGRCSSCATNGPSAGRARAHARVVGGVVDSPRARSGRTRSSTSTRPNPSASAPSCGGWRSPGGAIVAESVEVCRGGAGRTGYRSDPGPARRDRRARPLQPHRRHRRSSRSACARAGGRRPHRGRDDPGHEPLGAAWGLGPSDPGRGRCSSCSGALDDIAHVPPLA